MCGITGVLYLDGEGMADEAVLRRMNAALVHRGPDDAGVFIDGPVGLAMRRLSIIDVATGHQPIQNEDKTVSVVFNGEIYNYEELTRGLRQKGHTFQTSSDTEVIVHLYEEKGAACVEPLRGMFAFAVWDRSRRALLLARDRLGIKPLYYSIQGGRLVFGSELKALLADPDLRREVDPAGLMAYLRYGYVADPLTIFKGVHKLPPGHLLVARGSQVEIKPYWEALPFFAAERRWRSETACKEELAELLREAVQLRLVSDVPVGAFLSGGIDSSTVVALMAHGLDRPVKTFSIGFERKGFDELPYARAVARRLGTDHHELVLGPQSVDVLETIVWHFDEPFADVSAVPTYFVSALARQHVKVVLSGDGGDELFAGYDRYVVDHRRRRYDLVSRFGASGLLRGVSDLLPEGSPGKNYLYNVSLSRMERYLDGVACFPPRTLRRLLAADVVAALGDGDEDVFAPHIARSGSLGFPARLQYLDLKTYLPGDILTKVDRMSMAHSLEARDPLLDHRLVESMASMPAQWKLRGGETKYLFKQAVQGLLPREILARRKQGFGIPLEHWFRESLQAYMGDHLLGGEALRHGYFNRSFVEGLFRLYAKTARPRYLYRLWALLVFEIWYRMVLRGTFEDRAHARHPHHR